MSRADMIASRLAKLARTRRPRVLDLFGGCGGLSLGFQAAGCEVVAAVEQDRDAAATHGTNFHGGRREHMAQRDITSTGPAQLVRELQLERIDDSVDIIVGGPPCQAFARVGRPKLREIDEHPEAFRHDPRARLYIDYLQYVAAFRPLAVLMENVPDVLNHGGQNIAEEVCETLETYGYTVGYTLLNAAYYGVPQMRERMFLIGYKVELAKDVRFPEPTTWIHLPRGYEGSRRFALRFLRDSDLFPNPHRYVVPPMSEPSLPPAVTARDALHDLPPLRGHLRGESRRGVRKLDQLVRYDQRRIVSAYAEQMRNWKGFESAVATTGHVIRHLPRDWPIFQRMKSGEQYPEAYAHALSLLAEKLTAMADSKGRKIPNPGTPAHREIERLTVPPYDPRKFPNKWWKLNANAPVRTLMAHIGKDTYSHIHYDSSQGRTISVREAARLQSFPDGFQFQGAMNSGFRQIGNSVPPLLARALGEIIRETLLDAARSTCARVSLSDERGAAA